MGKYSKLLITGNSNKEKFTREKKKTFERLAQLIPVLQKSIILLSQRSFSLERFFTKSCILGKVFHASDHLTTL